MNEKKAARVSCAIKVISAIVVVAALGIAAMLNNSYGTIQSTGTRSANGVTSDGQLLKEDTDYRPLLLGKHITDGNYFYYITTGIVPEQWR